MKLNVVFGMAATDRGSCIRETISWAIAIYSKYINSMLSEFMGTQICLRNTGAPVVVRKCIPKISVTFIFCRFEAQVTMQYPSILGF